MRIADTPLTRLGRLAAVSLLVAALPVAVAAADAGQEVATAAEHSGYAAGSSSIEKVHLHLHHTINCLVGPDGDAFDAQAGNPCDGQGDGALNDMGDAMADQKAALKKALATAKDGVDAQSLDKAKSLAGEAHSTLEQAKGQ